MERYEYTIEGQKIVLTEADELFAILFKVYDGSFREKVEEYYYKLNEFADTITITIPGIKEAKKTLDAIGEETTARVSNFGSDSELAYCIDEITNLFEKMIMVASTFDFDASGIRYINVSKKIDEYRKKKALEDYNENYEPGSMNAELYEILCDGVSIVDVDDPELLFPIEVGAGVLRKYFLRDVLNDRVKVLHCLEFLEKCLTKEGRIGITLDLYEDCIRLLLHYLQIFSDECGFEFTPKYCLWDNYCEYIDEERKIEEDIDRGKVVTKQRIISNLSRFPFDTRPYGVLVSEYGLFDNQIIEIAKKVRISSKALEDINDEMGPTNLDKNFENELLNIIEKDIISVDGYTIIGNDLKKSNQKMATKAQNTLGIHKNDKIFMLSDGTLFKSFKEGFAICSSGIYARNPDKVIHRKWSELLNTQIERKGTNLIIDGLQVFTYVKKEEGEQLFADIKKLLQENVGEPEPQKNATEEKTVAISDIMQDENSVKKESVETKYCTECGTKVSSNAKFCQQCGNKLENTENVEEIKPQLFRVDLVDVGEEKARVIKIIMDNFKKDVRSAKEMTDSVPILLEENLLKEEADALEMLFRDAGAKVKLTRL